MPIVCYRECNSLNVSVKKETKRRKLQHKTPVLIGSLFTRKGTDDQRVIKILLDSGTSSTIISGDYCKKLRKSTDSKTKWNTKGGNFTTNYTAKLKFTLPELDNNKIVTWTAHVDDSSQPHRYDMIVGRDLLKALNINLDFGNDVVNCTRGTFNGCSTPMKHIDDVLKFEGYDILDEINESDVVAEATERATRIQAANYHKADLRKVVEKCDNLTSPEQDKLHKLLKRYEFLFDGTLGTWNTEPYNIELKDGAQPYHAKPYPIPRVHDKVFRDEIERMCKIGILRRVNDSEWGAPTFCQSKKNGTIRILTDLRELNKLIKRKPFPIPKVQEMLLKLEGFTYATSIDLNMGYYHIRLSPGSSRLCTMVLPFGKYEYLKLPMGLINSPDIFQEKISELFYGFEHVRAYIDDILLTTKKDWSDHLLELEQVLQKLAEEGLKVNANKSFFGRHECEYLGYWVTRTGIHPLEKKV